MKFDLTPEDDALLKACLDWFSAAESEHKAYERQWDHQDSLYFGHKRMVDAYTSASPRDRDGVLSDGRKEFGAELHIPYVFSMVETIMPRVLSNRPRMLWLPRSKTAEQNVENVRIVCDAQQQRANYELTLQTTARSGLKHGLGVQKCYWRREERDTFQLVKSSTGEWVRQPVKKVCWDDPDVDDVDIRDFFWDPFGDSMDTVRKVMHRTWRDSKYVLAKVQSGDWNKYPQLDAEDLKSMQSKEKYDQAWADRRKAQGVTSGNTSGGSDIHEVWEIHDGEKVYTVLDRRVIVKEMESPYWEWRLPFHIYRPVEVEHRFVGYGVIDPIEDLQKELDWLRTDRRWNAMLKLHQAYAYQDGALDPALMKIGPGSLTPVNGDPNDILKPLMVGDIPNSGYQEEVNLQRDIERTAGVDDTVAGASGGGGGAAETATGVQLVQAAAGLRIQAYTRRMELELITPEARQWLAMNQQHWTQERDVRVEDPQQPDPDRRWTWRTVGPAELAGEFEVVPEGGSTAPDNIPQQRQDALQAMQLWGQDPGVDRRKLTVWAMDKFGIASPDAFLAAPQVVPPETLDLIVEQLTSQGVPALDAKTLVGDALSAALDNQQQSEASMVQGEGAPPGDMQLRHAA